MSFTLIGTDTDSATSTLTVTTPVTTAIGDLVVIRIGADNGGAPNDDIINVDGFTRLHPNLNHASDTLSKSSFYRVADAAGAIAYGLTGTFGTAGIASLAVYRNDTGGGTWGLVPAVTVNDALGSTATVGPIASQDDSLLLFSGTQDDGQSAIAPFPLGMTAAAPDPPGGDTISLNSYFQSITTGTAETRTITFGGNDAVIADIEVFTYTIGGAALQSSPASVTTITGDLTVIVGTAGNASSVATVTGDLTTGINLAGNLSVVTTVTGDIPENAILARAVSQDGTAVNDSANWRDSGFQDSGLNINLIDFKVDTDKHVPTFLFDVSEIPAGATITSATVSWTWRTNFGSGNATRTVEFVAKDAANTGTLDVTNNGYQWAEGTGGRVTASVTDEPGTYLDGDPFTTPDLSVIIQELLDTYGASLQNLAFGVVPIGTAPVGADEVWGIQDSVDGDATAPKIDVTWTVAAGIAGSATSQASTTGALTTGINFAGSVNSVASVVGGLTTGIALNGSISSIANSTGALTTGINLAGGLNSASTVTGELTTSINFAGSIDSTSTVTGALTVAKSLAANAISVSTITGDLTVTENLVGGLVSEVTLTGDLTVTKSLAGSINSEATSSGLLSVPKTLVSSLVSVTDATGDLTTGISLNGVLAAVVSVTGIIQVAILNPDEITDTFGVSTTISVNIGVTSGISDTIGVSTTI